MSVTIHTLPYPTLPPPPQVIKKNYDWRDKRNNRVLSKNVFEWRTSTGRGRFASLGNGLVQTVGYIVFIREKKLSNTNVFASRHIYSEKASLSVDVCPSKTSLLKVPNRSRNSSGCFNPVWTLKWILKFAVSCPSPYTSSLPPVVRVRNHKAILINRAL